MAACEFKEKCPIFKRFRHEGIKNLWISRYCDTGGDNCKRKELRTSGKGALEVPVSLLPNGRYLDILEVFGENDGVKLEDDCRHALNCSALFNRFIDPDSRNFWGARYCFRKGEGCRRKEILDSGDEALSLPENLLPNGLCL